MMHSDFNWEIHISKDTTNVKVTSQIESVWRNKRTLKSQHTASVFTFWPWPFFEILRNVKEVFVFRIGKF